jgi:hypothetical protein
MTAVTGPTHAAGQPAFGRQHVGQRQVFEPATQRAAVARRADGDMVSVAPEADFVARLDPELVSEFLGDDDLSLRPDAVSHTCEDDSTRDLVCLPRITAC